MSFSSEVLADSPGLYYRFKEDPNVATGPQDSSGNGRHGTYTRTTEYNTLKYRHIGGLTDDSTDKAVVLGRVDEELNGPYNQLSYAPSIGQFETAPLPLGVTQFAVEVLFTFPQESILSLGGENKPFGWITAYCPGHFKIEIGSGGIACNPKPYVPGYDGGDAEDWKVLTYQPSRGPYVGGGGGASLNFVPKDHMWPKVAHVYFAISINPDGFSHVARCYINGVDRTTNGPGDQSFGRFSPSSYFRTPEMASRIYVGGSRGALDEFAWYDHVLDPARVVARYNTMLAKVIDSTPTAPSGQVYIKDASTFTTSLMKNGPSVQPITQSGAVLRAVPTLRIGFEPAGVQMIQCEALLRNDPQVFGNPAVAFSDPITATSSIDTTQPDGVMLGIIPTNTRLVTGIDDAEVIGPVTIAPAVTVTMPEMETQAVLKPATIRPRVSVSCRLMTPEPTETTYRLRVVDIGGNRLAELENADIGQVPWKVTGITGFKFTLPANDPKAIWCKEARYEVQVWRNSLMLWQGPIVRVSNNGKTIEAQCMDPNWYFTRRVVGRVPKQNLLESEDGQPANYAGWKRAFLPRSEPANNPAMTTTMENTYSDRPSLRLSSSMGRVRNTYSNDDWYDGTRLTSKGKKAIAKVLDELTEFTNRPRVMVKVYDDDSGTRTDSDNRAEARAEAVSDYILDNYEQAKVVVESPAYRDPLNANKTTADRKANRRTLLIFQSVDGQKGHKQHATQTVTLRNPSKKERKQAVSFTAYVFIEDEAGWAAGMKGIEVVRSDPKKKHPDPKWAKAGYKKPLQTGTVLFGDGFPTDTWVRVVATVILPNDGKRSQIEVRLFPPNGDALFSEMWLVRDQSLDFKRQEQADIVTRLVEHAQDGRMGKTDLNIGTNIAATGVKRTRSYPFDERATVYELLEEFPTLANGVEWQIVQTPETRTFTTYYPRLGRDTETVLAYGSNVASYGVASDGTLLATTVVIQAPTGDDYTREERSVSDPTLMDGVVLEEVYTATPNSPASSWNKQAERGLARYRRPITMPSLTMDPSFTNELLNTVAVGDRVLTNISDDAANVDDIQKCRVVEMYLDPKTDTLTYDLYPEDLNVVTLSPFGAPVRYFSQAQNPIVGASGKVPVQSNPEFGTRAYSDGSWPTGAAGVGWVKEATGSVLVNPSYQPVTVVPGNHEVWIRKWVNCTGDMVLTLRASDWTYLYVNGHLVGNDHFVGYNRYQRAGTVNLRIPSSWLDPSGSQLIAVHSQFDPALRSSDKMDSVYADVAVRGTYDPGAVT